MIYNPAGILRERQPVREASPARKPKTRARAAADNEDGDQPMSSPSSPQDIEVQWQGHHSPEYDLEVCNDELSLDTAATRRRIPLLGGTNDAAGDLSTASIDPIDCIDQQHDDGVEHPELVGMSEGVNRMSLDREHPVTDFAPGQPLNDATWLAAHNLLAPSPERPASPNKKEAKPDAEIWESIQSVSFPAFSMSI